MGGVRGGRNARESETSNDSQNQLFSINTDEVGTERFVTQFFGCRVGYCRGMAQYRVSAPAFNDVPGLPRNNSP